MLIYRKKFVCFVHWLLYSASWPVDMRNVTPTLNGSRDLLKNHPLSTEREFSLKKETTSDMSLRISHAASVTYEHDLKTYP